MAIIAVLLTACMADEVGGVYLITTEVDSLYPVENQRRDITFNTGGNWTAWTADSWLEVSPQTGKSGRNMITVRSTGQNCTKQSRKTQIVISSDGKCQTMPVIQRGDYALFDTPEHQVGAEGGKVTLTFATNVPKGALYISYIKYDWYSIENTKEGTRAEEWRGKIKPITVMPNDSTAARSAKFILGIYDNMKNFMVLDSTWIRQKGAVP